MPQMEIPCDLQVCGTLRATSIPLPAGTVNNNAVQAGAGIEASKLQHQYTRLLAQEYDTPATDERRTVHVAKSAGTIQSFICGNLVAKTTGAVTVDLKVNNASILSAVIEPGAAYATVSGTISTAAYSAGDIIEIEIVSTSCDAYGVFGQVALREAA